MENKINGFKENISDKLQLPKEVTLNLPKIIITGDEEINIENHKGIVFFEDEQIKINTVIGVITIKGNNFEILFIGGGTIVLGGKFKSIVYDGNE